MENHPTNDRREWYRKIYLKSEHWKQLRAKKLARNSKCAICGSMEANDIHHIRYSELFDVTTADLRLLCRSCHEKVHQLERDGLTHFRNGTTEGFRFEKIRKMVLGNQHWLKRMEKAKYRQPIIQRSKEMKALIEQYPKLYGFLCKQRRKRQEKS